MSFIHWRALIWHPNAYSMQVLASTKSLVYAKRWPSFLWKLILGYNMLNSPWKTALDRYNMLNSPWKTALDQSMTFKKVLQEQRQILRSSTPMVGNKHQNIHKWTGKISNITYISEAIFSHFLWEIGLTIPSRGNISSHIVYFSIFGRAFRFPKQNVCGSD